jgi:hypothetical protein
MVTKVTKAAQNSPHGDAPVVTSMCKNTCRSSCSVPITVVQLEQKLKLSNTKCNENIQSVIYIVVVVVVVVCRWTNRHGEENKHIFTTLL